MPARPLHVAFLALEYPPLPSGGIGTSLRSLARGLVRRGHAATVVGWGPDERFTDEGVEVRFLGSTRAPKLGWCLNRRRAARELRRLADAGAALVETHDWGGPSAGMHLPCPLLVRCHGSDLYFGELTGRRVRPTVAVAERLALRGADSVVAVSRFAAEKTRQLFGLTAPVGVIPNGVELARFAGEAPAAGEPTILYLGTLVRKKGVLDLPEIFATVLAAVPEARLVLAGRDAPDPSSGAASTWERLREALGPEARERATYLGPVAPAAVPDLLAAARVAVFPSYAEALPVSWIEAMAAARPIVAYGSGWAEELVVDEKDDTETGTGRLVPPGDTAAFAAAVVDLLSSDARAAAVGRRARRRVETRFTVDAVVDATLAWYRDVLADRDREKPG